MGGGAKWRFVALAAVVVLALSAAAARAGEDALTPPGPTGSGLVLGTVMGRYGTLLGVPVRVLVDGKVIAACRTGFNGEYRVEAPAGVEFDLEAAPCFWTELDPIRRRVIIDPDARTVEDFVFATTGAASGHMEGPLGNESITLFAIRVEDYPPSAGGWTPLPDLRRARKLATNAAGTFTFTGLDLGVTYRVAADGYEWGLARPVFLTAGDTGIAVPVERLLYFVVDLRDIEDEQPLARFTAKVIDREGQIRDRIEGRDGRLVHRIRHPEQIPPDPPDPDPAELMRRIEEWRKALRENPLPADLPSLLVDDPLPPWKVVVEADGYFDAKGTFSGVQRLFLQRVREPNVILLVKGDDGKPCDMELEGAFEAAEQPAGAADARVAREGPGRFRAVLPPGSWRLKLPGVAVDIVVPARGTVTVETPPVPCGKQ